MPTTDWIYFLDYKTHEIYKGYRKRPSFCMHFFRVYTLYFPI